MNIVVIEIKKPISEDKLLLQNFCDSYAKFYQEYHDSWIILVSEKIILNGHATVFLNDRYDIKVEKLNKIAFNRLISNLEKDYPEMSLILMGAGEESKLFKIRERIQK